MWSGCIQPLTSIVKTEHRFGSEGHIIESYGKVASESPIILIQLVQDYKESLDYINSINNLIGNVVEVIDGIGVFHKRICVKSIKKSNIKLYLGTPFKGIKYNYIIVIEIVIIKQPD